MNARDLGRVSKVLTTSMSRRTALRRACLAGASTALLAAVWSQHGDAAGEEGLPDAWFAPDATLGSHGMVIVGEGPVYLSHLPMFMFDSPANHPHHYQVIVEVSFDDAGRDAYREDRLESEAPLYTLWPQDAYRMLDLILPGPSESPVESLTGKIVRGHWEREGQPQPFDITWDVVQEDVPVTVERVVYAHEFSFHPRPLDRLEYVLFGAGDDLFLAHRMVMAPDFDQILPVTIEADILTEERLREGLVIAIPERANTIAERLADGEQVTAEVRHAATGAALAAGMPIEAGQELFFEEGELRIPLDMAATDEELASGFAFP